MRYRENLLLMITYLLHLSIPFILTPWGWGDSNYNNVKAVGMLIIPVAFSAYTVLMAGKRRSAKKPWGRAYLVTLAVGLVLNYLIFRWWSLGVFSGPVAYSNIKGDARVI